MLTARDIAELTAFRRQLHRFPDLSGQEGATAGRIVAALTALSADRVISGLGGQGVAAVFNGSGPGQTLMFRAELDALPIAEISTAPHRSTIAGKGHLCGHDGHMAILLALGRLLSRQRPASGRVVLMFQPAEEDGSGAAAVIADPGFAALRPDWAFALHNMPGARHGQCWLKDGAVNCASVGIKISLQGKTSHAAQPELGLSPAPAIAQLLTSLPALGRGGEPGPGYRLVTLTHASLGEPVFGIAPGHGEVRATLRTLLDAPMAALKKQCQDLTKTLLAGTGLTAKISFHDDFAACVNDPDATRHLFNALKKLGIPAETGDLPMRASEDFGRFGTVFGTRSAMLFLGAGTSHPALHNPDYDFPDDLIPIGAAVFHQISRDLLG